MERILKLLYLVCCFRLAAFTDPECVIELECAECIPDSMPLVTSHAAAGGAVRAAGGDELALACPGGAFLLYPARAQLAVVCERGRYRVSHDGTLRHLLELGCQENIFEDVEHSVEHCAPPLVGRAYRTASGGGERHLATVCFDADRALAVRLRATSAARNALPLPPHSDQRAPLSLLGNFNHMFDASTRAAAERLYSDDARLTRRLHELLKHDHVTFAGQTLTSAPLLHAHYFEDQNMRVADFVSNRVAVWSSVAGGNLRHLAADVGGVLRGRRGLHVHAGTHGTLAARTPRGPVEAWLKPGRFPVPKYIWTVVHDTVNNTATAIVVLNDPFVSVSEIRAAVFCASQCGRVAWARGLRAARRYEAPLYGLAFCCHVHDFVDKVPEMPRDIFKNVPAGDAGLLL